MVNLHLHRGHLLLDQKRWRDALGELGLVLAAEPESAVAHRGCAMALLNLEQFAEAERHARAAVAADPNDSDALYTLGCVLYERQRLRPALDVLDSSLEIEPRAPDTLGLRAHVLCDLVRWKQALESSEAGLEIDPENSLCLTSRARALVGQGSPIEAQASLADGLCHDIENPMLHAGMGWAALASKDRDKALVHFHEALRLDPELEWAREGMMEALRTKYLFYRLIFGYHLWMSRMTPGVRWAVIVGGYFAAKLLGKMARPNPAIAPLIWLLIALFVGFVYLSWTGQALANLMLSLSRNGRMLLNTQERLQATWVGWLWAISALALVIQACGGHGFGVLGLIALLQAMPTSALFICQEGRPMQWMGALCAALLVAGFGGFSLGWIGGLELGKALARSYFPLLMVTLVVSNVLGAWRPQRD